LKSNKQKMALALMASGALPFIAAAYLTLPGVSLDAGIQGELLILVYGAVILSFLGGIRWGAALQSGPPAVLFGSVLSSLVGVSALLMGFGFRLFGLSPSLWLLVAGFTAQAAWDYFGRGTLPDWFVRLRMAISTIVIVCLLITLLI
jgi:Protein of unknown function (DUF3429)